MRNGGGYAVLFAFIAGAMLTPTPDVFNQTLMALPIGEKQLEDMLRALRGKSLKYR